MPKKPLSRSLKKQVFQLLAQDDFDAVLKIICQFPAKQVIGPLFSHFYNKEEIVRWRAVTAMGFVVSGLGESGNMEAARVVMRRLMWNLNDESGGIGWGSPEAMGEITARSPRLAQEFHKILTSYAWEEGNFLEHEILQRGVLWGIGRLSHVQPNLISYALAYILPFMDSHDPYHRGLAAWAAGPISDESAKKRIKNLYDDTTPIRVFLDNKLIDTTVGDLARKSIN